MHMKFRILGTAILNAVLWLTVGLAVACLFIFDNADVKANATTFWGGIAQ